MRNPTTAKIARHTRHTHASVVPFKDLREKGAPPSRTSPGFTLIELMIVVAIISVIAGIAIPNLIRSRMSANESNAVAGLRTISTAEVAYQAAGLEVDSSSGLSKYGVLSSLGSGNTPFIDSALSSGTKQGYSFQISPTLVNSSPSYTATAEPTTTGKTGIKHYFVDDTGVIRFNGKGKAATSGSLPLN